MSYVICRSFYLFFAGIEYIVLAYMLSFWFPIGKRGRVFMHEVTAPILNPIRALLKHSIFFSQLSDFSPLIAIVITVYLQKFFYILGKF